MIGLILAAAVASAQPHLTQDELAQAINKSPEVIAHTQYRENGSDPCFLAQDALSIAGDLRQALDLNYFLVMVPALNAKLWGDATHSHGFKLTVDEQQYLTMRMHEFETEAKIQKTACES